MNRAALSNTKRAAPNETINWGGFDPFYEAVNLKSQFARTDASATVPRETAHLARRPARTWREG